MCETSFGWLFTPGILCLACAVVLFPSATESSLTVASQIDKNNDAQPEHPKGHLEPLGSHRPPEGTIQTVNGFLDPKEFYTNHVLGSKPVLFKGAAHDLPAYKLWSDTYLK